MNAVDLITSLLAVPSPAPAGGSSDGAGHEAFATELAAALAGLAEGGADVTSDALSAEVTRLLENATDPVVVEQLSQLLDLLAVAGDTPLQSPLVADLVARFVVAETTVSATPGGPQSVASTVDSTAPTVDQGARLLPVPVPSTTALPSPVGRSFDGTAAPTAPPTAGPDAQPVALVARTITLNAPVPGNAGQAIPADAERPAAAPVATPPTTPASQTEVPAASAAAPPERQPQAPAIETLRATPAGGANGPTPASASRTASAATTSGDAGTDADTERQPQPSSASPVAPRIGMAEAPQSFNAAAVRATGTSPNSVVPNPASGADPTSGPTPVPESSTTPRAVATSLTSEGRPSSSSTRPPEARAMLLAQLDDLRAAFAESGLHIEDVTVELADSHSAGAQADGDAGTTERPGIADDDTTDLSISEALAEVGRAGHRIDYRA